MSIKPTMARLASIMAGGLLLCTVTGAQAVPINTGPLPAGTFITIGNLDWTYASPVSSINFANSNVLELPSFRPGWRFATVAEFANRPTLAQFNNGTIHSAAFWNSNFDFVNVDNYSANLVNRMIVSDISSTNFWEMVYVRDVNGQIPEPGTLAILGLGLAGLGFARRRKAAV